jgi:hypothetical protein
MDVIKSEVYSWAAETSQEHVAIEICKAWFLSGERSECIKLYPMDDGCGQADWQAINNRQNCSDGLMGSPQEQSQEQGYFETLS